MHVPAGAPSSAVSEALIEWNGTQRWHAVDSDSMFDVAAAAGGYATLFRPTGPVDEVFSRPAEPLLRLHASLKKVFDPAGILNPGRMFPDF